MGEERNAYKILSENLKESDHLEDLCIDGRILKQMANKDGKMWTGYIWVGTGTSGRFHEDCNGP
jgi:hypothetical protein